MVSVSKLKGTWGGSRQVAQWKLGCVSMISGLYGAGCRGELMKMEMFLGSSARVLGMSGASVVSAGYLAADAKE